MNTDKQAIEEMDTVIRSIVNSHFVQIPQYSKYGGYDGTKEMLTRQIAVELYNKGYHKQSENTVEVVRCKDCKHFKGGIYCYLTLNYRVVRPEHFCSCGEPKMKGGAEG